MNDKFKAAGLQTEIVPYSVLLNKPVSILIEAFGENGTTILTGPNPEHVDLPTNSAADRFQTDPRILPAFNDSSPSADVTAQNANPIQAHRGRLPLSAVRCHVARAGNNDLLASCSKGGNSAFGSTSFSRPTK